MWYNVKAMISLISGEIINKNNNELVVLTSGGVGYRVMTSPSVVSSSKIGDSIRLETYLSVKEDAMDLFGFGSLAEKELFKNFLTVSGVGPKTAMHLLELGNVEEITLAIGRGDVDFLTKVSGIGKKTAERIVVELKNKIAKGMTDSGVKLTGASDVQTDVVDALMTLGYSALQARDVIKSLDCSGKNSEQLLREALTKIK